jgi:hypothetical protein
MNGNSFLKSFPAPGQILNSGSRASTDFAFEINGHIHTPYSFSAFENIDQVFRLAVEENIRVLGINDFYVTDGYQAFHEGCLRAGIFPLFNIEFIGLMKEEQEKGIRINDPNNPGRIYFCGKGLDYPYHLTGENMEILSNVMTETQKQLHAMVDKLNGLIEKVNPLLRLDFEDIKNRYAFGLVRERHIAKALRILTAANFKTDMEQVAFLELLYGGKKSKAGAGNDAAIENEIRSNILKAGGTAFVEEDEKSFLDIKRIIEIITDAGGIPCYPVLLDDPAGKCTEFETDYERLYSALSGMGVRCIELIPGRNDAKNLEEFVSFFDEKGFIITFGTEHNTPEMIPLTVSTRDGKPLSEKMKKINMKGASVIASHQYLRSQGMAGFVDEQGRADIAATGKFEDLGKKVIEYHLRGK